MPGLNNTSGNDNKKWYNGKEMQDDLPGVNLYDFNFRANYDPQIGRFHSPDPMAILTPGISPYAYAYDNPINGIDDYGLGFWSDLWNRAKDVALRAVGFTRHGGVVTGEARNVYYTWDHKGKSSSNSSSSSGNSTASVRTPYVPDKSSSNMALMEPDKIDYEPGPIPDPIPVDVPKPPITVKAGEKLNYNREVKFKSNSNDFYNVEATDEALSELVNSLKADPAINVLIMGNTGTETNDPNETYGNSDAALNSPATINGTNGTIRDLMNARAKAVFNYLIRHGIDPNRLKYGPGTRYNNPSGRKTTFRLNKPE
jgi:RHS repeat-associated protein